MPVDGTAPPNEQHFVILPRVVNGGIAGIIGVSSMFPLDLVKTRLQNQQLGPHGQKMYKNMLDCFRQTYRAEGYFGMYRGSAVNILLITPAMAIELVANDVFRHHLTREDGTLPVAHQMAAGGLAGALQVIITTPMELLKIRMQSADPAAAVPKPTATQIASQVIREKGITGLYKGIGATALRDVTFSVVYYPLFAKLNGLGPRRMDGSGQPIFWCSFLSGCTAGCTAALMVNPFDVVKTRLQSAKRTDNLMGVGDCIAKTLRQQGFRAFLMGGTCRMIVIAPISGIIQMVYFLDIADVWFGLKKG